MNRKYVIGVVLVVFVVGVGLAVAFYLGVEPAPGGESGEEIEDFPTEEQGDTGGPGTTSPDETDPFTFSIDNIEECGQTCRDVTATLENNQDETATGVSVYIRIFAGEDNTETGDMVWEGTEDSGTIEAGGTHTTTERVELSLRDGRKIDQREGWITILTTVQTDERTVTFQDSEQVA